MERTIVEVEENQHRSSSSIPVSKSSQSLVKIDSISIELGIALENNEAGECKHFSIRGYVSEMREKDMELCLPFAANGNSGKSEEQISVLPSLYVPKFRWWRCQNCLQEIGTAIAAEDETAFISNSTCSHRKQCQSDPAVFPSDLMRASKLDKVEGKKAVVYKSLYLNGDVNYLSLCNNNKENIAEVGPKVVNGAQNDFGDDADTAIDNPSSDVTTSNPCLTKDRHIDGAVALKSYSGRVANICEPDCRSHDASDITPATDFPKCAGMYSTSTDILLEKKMIPADDKLANLLMACETSKEPGKIDKAVNAGTYQAARPPSLELEERENMSSESDEILAGYHDQYHSNSSGLVRRKTRKVRLLTDLLGKNAENDQGRIEDASIGMPNESAGLPSVSAPLGSVNVHENVAKSFWVAQKKRKMPQEEDWRPLVENSSNNIPEKVSNCRGDTETAPMTIEILDSEPEEGASRGECLQTALKCQWSKLAIHSDSMLCGKKQKLTQPDDGCSPFVPWQQVMAEKNHIRIKDAESGAVVNTGVSKVTLDAFTGRGMEPCFNSYLSPQQTERKSILSKKKNKMPQIQYEQIPLMYCQNMFGEGSSNSKEVEFVQTGSEMVNLQSANDASAKLKLDLSLNSYMDAQKDENSYITKIEDKTHPLWPQKKGVSSKDIRNTDDTHGESSILQNSAADRSLKEGLLCDLNERITHRTTIMHKQRNGGRLLEDDLHKRLDFSGPCNNDNSMEVLGHSEAIYKCIDQRADKVFEKGISEDIPMEIVELMAKNQYERGLCEAEINDCLWDRNNKRNAEMMSLPKVHEHGAMRSLRKEYPVMGKFSSDNKRNGITVENMGATKRNPVNFSHINRNFVNMFHLDRDNSPYAFLNTSPQSQQNLSAGAKFSASGPSRYGNSQNSEWNGDTLIHKFSPNNMQVLEAYNTWHTGSRHNEEAEHVWSPMTPKHMPFGLSVLEKGATQSSNMDVRVQGPDQMHKGRMMKDIDLNSLNPHSANMVKQNAASVGYQFNSKQRETEINSTVMGSLDLYSNETIPAMQLLSLMDAGSKSFNVDTKRLLEKPFSPCDYHPKFSTDEKQNFLEKSFFQHHRHHSKELSGLGPVVCKARDGFKHPSLILNGKNRPSEKSCECSPAVPAVNPFASSQSDGNCRRGSDFTGYISFKSQGQEKSKTHFPPTQNRGRRPQKSASTRGVSLSIRDSDPNLGKQKEILCASDFMVLPMQRCTPGRPTKSINLENRARHGTVWPVKSISRNDICSVNRNPADFSIPEAGNVYMISGEDLKFGRKYPSKNSSGSIHVDGQKRCRVRKLAAAKNQGQQHLP